MAFNKIRIIGLLFLIASCMISLHASDKNNKKRTRDLLEENIDMRLTKKKRIESVESFQALLSRVNSERAYIKDIKSFLKNIPKKKAFDFLVTTKTQQGSSLHFALKNNFKHAILNCLFQALAKKDRCKALASIGEIKSEDQQNTFKFSLIQLAIRNGNTKFITTSLKNINENDCYELLSNIEINKSSALHIAILYANKETVQEIYNQCPISKRDAYLLLPDSAGNTPLHLAIKLQRTDIVKLLLEYIPQDKKYDYLCKKNNEYYTVMHSAIMFSSTEVFKEILMYLPQDKLCSFLFKKNILFWAINSKQDEIKIQMLANSITYFQTIERKTCAYICTKLKNLFSVLENNTQKVSITIQDLEKKNLKNQLWQKMFINNQNLGQMLQKNKNISQTLRGLPSLRNIIRISMAQTQIVKQLDMADTWKKHTAKNTHLLVDLQKKKQQIKKYKEITQKTFGIVFLRCIYKDNAYDKIGSKEKDSILKNVKKMLKEKEITVTPETYMQSLFKDFFAVLTNKKPSNKKYNKEKMGSFFATPKELYEYVKKSAEV